MVDLGPDVSGVWRGDGGRLRQVLANLASNAVKFTHQGEVRVTLRRSPDGIACAVADTGIGIPKDRLSLLFQRFSQVDPTATRKAGGSGLGLAICRDLVELLGGQVSVTSEEGEGTTFNFQIPLTFVEAPQPADIGEVETGDFGPIRILAAEDNHVNQIILGAILEPIGAELSLVADGQAALELFQREAFDLVLMDIQMPVMNGIEATMAIRRFEAETGRWRTPIVALSANVMHHQLQEYLAAGMDGLIAKPIEMRELIGGVRKALCPDVTPGEALAAAG